MARSRWDNPIWYSCSHEGCETKARILVRQDEHVFQDRKGEATSKAHNCCCGH